jgi:hypothetical protein
MSMPALFWRFALACLVLLLGLGLVLNLLGVQSSSGASTAALLAAVMWSCMSFGKKNNGRYFSPVEKRRVVLGMLAIDMGLQLAFAVAAAWFAPSAALSLGAIAFALLFVAVLHAVVIYLFVGLAGRQVAASAAATAGKSRR